MTADINKSLSHGDQLGSSLACEQTTVLYRMAVRCSFTHAVAIKLIIHQLTLGQKRPLL